MDAATDGRKIRARLGVVPQLDTLDKELSVMENLVLYGRFFDIPRAECRRRAKELLEFVQLSERADSVVETAQRRHDAPAVDHPLVDQPARTCSCSTSRPPVSIRRLGTCCGTGCIG